jgi:HPr kinase/phosphorylase
LVQIHATSISINAHAVLFRGPSGSGKSDLALRMIDRGAKLVSDDRCNLEVSEDRIMVTAPETISGLMEIRGVGVVNIGTEPFASLALIVDLVSPEEMDRMPEKKVCTEYGAEIPVIKMTPFEASTPAKVLIALSVALGEMESLSELP